MYLLPYDNAFSASMLQVVLEHHSSILETVKHKTINNTDSTKIHVYTESWSNHEILSYYC